MERGAHLADNRALPRPAARALGASEVEIKMDQPKSFVHFRSQNATVRRDIQFHRLARIWLAPKIQKDTVRIGIGQLLKWSNRRAGLESAVWIHHAHHQFEGQVMRRRNEAVDDERSSQSFK